MSSNTSQNLSENTDTILNDIQQLQEMEKNLFVTLETNPHLTSEQQKQLVSKMNNLSNMRINLYKTLSGVNSFFQNALETSTGTLKEQTIAIGIVENQLNQAKMDLNLLKNSRNEKIRLVEINDYYGEKYSEHAKFMKTVIFTLIPIIILAVLNKKDLLPNNIYYILVGIIAFIGVVIGWLQFFSIISRDNMNYETYNWDFDPSTAPSTSSSSTSTSSTSTSTSTDPWSAPLIPCMGANCCSSSETFDVSNNVCITSTTESFITESMVEKVLTKNQEKYKSDVNITPQYQGVTSKSFIYGQ
jgi:hypothetical protein